MIKNCINNEEFKILTSIPPQLRCITRKRNKDEETHFN